MAEVVKSLLATWDAHRLSSQRPTSIKDQTRHCSHPGNEPMMGALSIIYWLSLTHSLSLSQSHSLKYYTHTYFQKKSIMYFNVCVFYWILSKAPRGSCWYLIHFIDEDTEAHRLKWLQCSNSETGASKCVIQKKKNLGSRVRTMACILMLLRKLPWIFSTFGCPSPSSALSAGPEDMPYWHSLGGCLLAPSGWDWLTQEPEGH